MNSILFMPPIRALLLPYKRVAIKVATLLILHIVIKYKNKRREQLLTEGFINEKDDL
jgi:hypothetical protein